jgi:dehydrogenase/reductase SDR family member 12
MRWMQLVGAINFYARFTPSFSRLGYGWRRRRWPPLQPAFDGQTWLVTGASAGIGRAIVRAAASHGAEVLAVARSADRLGRLGEGLEAEAAARIRPLPADLSRCLETAALLERLAVDGRTIDVLVNNAGVLRNDHSLTEEGMEPSFVINLLSAYQLTETLIAREGLAPHAMVVNMSSGGMYNVPLGLTGMDATAPEHHIGALAYARHKRAQVVLSEAWQRRLAATGRRSYVMHPGWVATDGVRESLPTFWKLQRPILRTPEEGADTALWLCATRPAPVPESLWFDRQPRPVHVFGYTRQPQCSLEELTDFLDARLARAGISR